MNTSYQMRMFFEWQEQHQLSTVAIALYYTLLNYAGKCRSIEFSVAISTLARHTGMSERSVFRARKLLEEHRLITIEQTTNRDCAQYTILEIPGSDTQSDSVTHSRIVRHRVRQCDTVAPLTYHTDTSTSVIISNDSIYSKFNIWLAQNAPRVQQMQSPITESQFHLLINEYPKQEIIDVILSMENYRDLHKKNISAYLTALAWLKRKSKSSPSTKQGKVDTMIDILNKIQHDNTTIKKSHTADAILLED